MIPPAGIEEAVFAVIHTAAVTLILSIVVFLKFHINVFAKCWSTDKLVFGPGAYLDPFFERTVLVYLANIIKYDLICQYLNKIHKK